MGDQSKPHSSRHGRGRIWRDLRPRVGPDDYDNAVDGWTEYDLPTHDRQGRAYPAIRPSDYPADIVLRRLRGVTGCRPQWYARCPAHADSRASLSVTELDDGTLLVHCFADCRVGDVVREIGLTERQLFVSDDARCFEDRRGEIKTGPHPTADEGPVSDPDIDYARFTRIVKNCQVGGKKLRELARQLQLPLRSLLALQVGHDGRHWVFPERDSMQRVTGIVYRRPDGSRFCEDGSKRGLTIPSDHASFQGGLVYLPEGATDTAALHSVGALAFGRPAASSSKLATRWLTNLLRDYDDRDVIVVGDRDQKKNGKSAGRDAARRLAEYLTTALGQEVRWALPRRGYKDVRAQVVAREWDRGLIIQE
jgi:hypothetical protein